MKHYERNDITTINVAGKEYSAIIIGPEENNVPRHLLQRERLDGMIVDGEKITPFKWRGVTKDEKYQYIYFDKCDIEPLCNITTKYRDKALELVMEIAHGLSEADEAFLDLDSSTFPIYRLYILDKSKILILPPDMGNLISIARMGERRDKEDSHLVKADSEPSFRLVIEMAELLYWASTGILPYENEDVRTCLYNEVPLEWYSPELDSSSKDLINSILHMKERAMRDIGGNRKPNENLGWFIKHALDVRWNLPKLSREERDERIAKTTEDPKYQSFFEKIEKEAKKRNFWRTKGTIVITISIISLILLSILITMIKGHFEPPYTRDMDREEFIENFYLMQENLDSANLDTAFKTDIPQSTEVLNLFVTKQTRTAYEIYDPHIKASVWVSEGKPAVMYDTFIYGVDLHSIEALDEDTYRAKSTWYTPYSYEEGEEDYVPPEGYVAVYSYDTWQDFTFEWNDRGWWNVVGLEIPHYEFIERELVETYERPGLL